MARPAATPGNRLSVANSNPTSKDARTNGMNSRSGFHARSIRKRGHDRLQSFDARPLRTCGSACVAHTPHAAIGV
jgi:hypothetical protein